MVPNGEEKKLMLLDITGSGTKRRRYEAGTLELAVSYSSAMRFVTGTKDRKSGVLWRSCGRFQLAGGLEARVDKSAGDWPDVEQ